MTACHKHSQWPPLRVYLTAFTVVIVRIDMSTWLRPKPTSKRPQSMLLMLSTHSHTTTKACRRAPQDKCYYLTNCCQLEDCYRLEKSLLWELVLESAESGPSVNYVGDHNVYVCLCVCARTHAYACVCTRVPVRACMHVCCVLYVCVHKHIFMCCTYGISVSKCLAGISRHPADGP